MKKVFFALVYAVLTADLFSSCDTTGGGGSLTEANALPVSVECIDGTFKLEGIPAKTETSGDALQLV